jgi:hypothetical protein
MVGGGSSGGTLAADPALGGATTFSGTGVSMTANGGGTASGGTSPAGGTASGGDINITGGDGGAGDNNATTVGGTGGASYFGGGGGGGLTGNSGHNAAAFGSGGGGGAGVSNAARAGGAAGGYSEKVIGSPAATYSYSVGTGGSGVSGAGNGAGGVIIIEEFYKGLNVQMSADTDTRVVAFDIAGATNTNIPSSATTLIWSSLTLDTHSGYNGSTGYVVPVAGIYLVQVQGILQTPGTGGGAAGTQFWTVLKNGSGIAGGDSQYGTTYAAGSNYCSPVTMVVANQMKAGDVITVTVGQNAGGTTGPNASASRMTVTRLSGPSVIASTESVNCAAINSSGQTLSNNVNTTITGWTKKKDTHLAFNASTGVYTIPVSGSYRASMSIGATPGTSSVGIIGSQINQAGSSSLQIRANTPFSTVGNNSSATTSYTFNCLAGDTLTFSGVQDNGASLSLDTSSFFCWLSIERVGN